MEANAFGVDGVGCDISAFNCLLSQVKTRRYANGELELALRGVLKEARNHGAEIRQASPWLVEWYSPRALRELIAYRDSLERLEPPYADVARIVLSRAARSARLTTHFDLEFPRRPILGAYFCYKHKRTCRPVGEAWKFLVRYTADTVRRLRAFEALRSDREVVVIHGDSRTVELPLRPTGVITSPPYPGLIDYHEQHRYAYELLGLEDRGTEEIGAAASGRSRAALAAYVDAMSEVLSNTSSQLPRGAHFLIVVNDSHNLYPRILDNANLILGEKVTRHVNRRTGRRAGEFFEDILVCRVA